jgi:hypothetical protein
LDINSEKKKKLPVINQNRESRPPGHKRKRPIRNDRLSTDKSASENNHSDVNSGNCVLLYDYLKAIIVISFRCVFNSILKAKENL